MFGFGKAGFKHGDLGPGQRLIAARLLHVLAADEPGLGAPVGELQRLRLARQIVPGNAEPGLQGAHLDIIEGHLGHQRNLGVVQAGLRRLQIGLGRLDAAPDPAENVQLPARIQADAEQIARCAAAALGAGIAAARRTGAGHARQAACRGHRATRARLAQPGLRAAQIGAGQQRLLHQFGQQRVVESAPPVAQIAGGRGMDKRRIDPAPVRGHRRRRRPVIRTHRGAAGQAERDQGNQAASGQRRVQGQGVRDGRRASKCREGHGNVGKSLLFAWWLHYSVSSGSGII